MEICEGALPVQEHPFTGAPALPLPAHVQWVPYYRFMRMRAVGLASGDQRRGARRQAAGDCGQLRRQPGASAAPMSSAVNMP